MRRMRMLYRTPRLLLVALLVSVGLALPAPSRAAGSVWCVSNRPSATSAPCVNGDAFTSIQAAIDSAAPGDEIRVARGTYVGGSEAVITIAATVLTIIGGYADGAWSTPMVD